LEVKWWRVHHYLRREAPDVDATKLIDALIALYAHVYRTGPTEVRRAASERAEAMRISDRWVADGCDPDSPQLHVERAALVRRPARGRSPPAELTLNPTPVPPRAASPS